MNEALYKLHSVDVDEADLGDFGKRGNLCYCFWNFLLRYELVIFGFYMQFK